MTIEYCDECMYLKPALEAAQKILNAHADKLEAVALKPGHDGVFRVTADDILIIQMGDEGLPNAERVAQAVSQFLAKGPHPQPLCHPERSEGSRFFANAQNDTGEGWRSRGEGLEERSS